MRTVFRAGAALAMVCLGVVGPASAATTPTVVAQASAAQSTLSGHITDSRGAALGCAAVAVEGGGKTYTTTTGADGSFTVSVPPGL
ncbi:MAG: carboxypeptidase regulatory-like domain-containing protein, partial [Candidatus Eremiobacteraeota bacterium]|nr:carboxypeptidase regulatory-like domain-containing protein [Candidatus Eremiobacteraeota bacterium]